MPLSSRGRARLAELDFQKTVELAGEIDGDPRMYPALVIVETLRPHQGKHALVPDVGMDIASLLTAKTKANKVVWGYVIAGEGQRHHVGLAVLRYEQLSTVRMIICMPE